MKRTPLYDAHVAAGGRLVDFAGWEMPIQYSGVVDEYHAVRRGAGLFDVSHMGRLLVKGKGALAFLQRVTTNDASRLEVLDSQYSMVCNSAGGIKDDIFVYRTQPHEFLLCVNASNREKIAEWLHSHAKEAADVDIDDQSAAVAQLALQGPASRGILLQLGVAGLEALRPRRGLYADIAGWRWLVTRTGYTGEVGYELYGPSQAAPSLWDRLLKIGTPAGLKPAGLGARDLLRLDMAYLLYGNDIGEETTPIEAGSEWVIAFHKAEFIGRPALQEQRDRGVSRRLIAFELLEKAVPRHGCRLRSAEASIGEVTSGNLSPLLQKGVGLGYVSPAYAGVGCRVDVDIRGKSVPAIVVKPPFYKRRA
jgi:aminomethyltransferase